MSNNKRKIAFGVCAILTIVLLIGIGAATAQETTKKLTGTVVAVDGNNLLVKMSTGEVQLFTPPPDRKFIIDGKPLTLAELQPGTHLTATITESATTATQTTIEMVEGDVLYAAGPTVVLKLASGEAKKYNVKHTDPVTFSDHNGKEITVFDLRKGMHVTAKKISEAPITILATSTDVTGTAPVAKEAAAPAAAAGSEAAPAMPKTGSSLPLVGQLGLLLICLAFGIRRYLL